MTDRFDGGDESRVQALMAENERLLTKWSEADALWVAAKAEVKRLREHIHDEEHFDVPMDECSQCAAVEAYFAGPANV